MENMNQMKGELEDWKAKYELMRDETLTLKKIQNKQSKELMRNAAESDSKL